MGEEGSPVKAVASELKRDASSSSGWMRMADDRGLWQSLGLCPAVDEYRLMMIMNGDNYELRGK